MSPIIADKKQWSPEVSIARAIAILLVVFGHSAYISYASSFGGVNYTSAYQNSSFIDQAIKLIIGVIYGFHMPLFVFMSGVTYGIGSSSGKIISSQHLVLSKFRRLIVPYFLFSFLWVVPIKLAVGYFSKDNIYNILVKGICLGIDAGHLWFLMMLFWIFIAIAVINFFSPSWKWIVILGALLCVGACYSEKLPDELLQLKKAAKMFVFFACGVVAAKNKMYDINRASIQGYLGLTLSSVAVFILLYINEKIKFIPFFSSGLAGCTITYYGTGLAGSLSVFGIAGLIARSNLISFKKLMAIVDRHSFRIYIFHDPLNYLILAVFCNIGLLKFFGSGGNAGAASFVVIRFFCCLGISILLNTLLNFIMKSASLGKSRSEGATQAWGRNASSIARKRVN